MTKVVFLHANCADGFGAAYAVWSKYPTAQFIPCWYGEKSFAEALSKVEGPLQHKEVFIVDFSFPRADMETLFNTAGRVVWLDHHKTAFEAFGFDGLQRYFSATDPSWKWPEHEIVLDNNRSGALIAWNYIFPGEDCPALFAAIDDYDRWQFKLDNTKAINKAIWSYVPWTFEMWGKFANDSYLSSLIEQGETLQRVHDANVFTAVKSGKINCWIGTPPCEEYAPIKEYDATADGFVMLGLAVNCPGNMASDVGHMLANESGTYGLCWSLGSDFKVKCSLRSNGEYDVSAIAKAFNGGGHRNAAGFTISVDTLLEWLAP